MKLHIKQRLSVDYYYLILRSDKKSKIIIDFILLKFVAYLVVSIHKFLRNRSAVTASALSYYSITSIVPVLALMLAVAKGFGGDKVLKEWLQEQMYTNEEVVEIIIDFSSKALDYSQNGLIAGVGVIILLWTMIKMLSNVEISINRVWGINKNRNIFKRLIYYFAFLIVAPILIIIISSINVVAVSYIKTLILNGGLLGKAGEFLSSMITFAPYFLVWVCYILIYKLTPNIKVNFKSALISGILAGTIFQLVQWFYLKFQIGVSSYNAIYGGFAALPLMLVWLNISWNIVLWGAELSYVVQNGPFLFKDIRQNINPLIENADIVIKMMKYISSHFIQNKGGVTVNQLCKELDAKAIDVQIVVESLLLEDVLVETNVEIEPIYFPKNDPHSFTDGKLLSKIMHLTDCRDAKVRERLEKAIIKEFDNRYLQ